MIQEKNYLFSKVILTLFRPLIPWGIQQRRGITAATLRSCLDGLVCSVVLTTSVGGEDGLSYTVK